MVGVSGEDGCGHFAFPLDALIARGVERDAVELASRYARVFPPNYRVEVEPAKDVEQPCETLLVGVAPFGRVASTFIVLPRRCMCGAMNQIFIGNGVRIGNCAASPGGR
mgnify:CR=1 FL=1